MTRAESVRVAYPLFQAGGGGASPTSALQLWVDVIDLATAKALNRRWHSTLPRFGTGAVKEDPNGERFLCHGAVGPDGLLYAVAIWSAPAGRMNNGKSWLELRRLADSPDAPRNTASRMLAVMTRLIRQTRPAVVKLVTQHDTDAHTGAIYAAAGWVKVGRPRRNGSAGEWATRGRPPVQSTAPKQRWEKVLHG